MRVALQATDAELLATDCCERAHAALRATLAKATSAPLVKGGEVHALEELAELTSRAVDRRLRAMAKAARAH